MIVIYTYCPNNTGIKAKSSCDDNVVIVALAISVAVLLTSNVFIFIMGYICGHCFSQKCKKMAEDDTLPSHPAPIYENLQLETIKDDDEQVVELAENVAYGHLQTASN